MTFSLIRGFGFVTFADITGVDKVLEHGSHNLDGKKVSFKQLRQTFLKTFFKLVSLQMKTAEVESSLFVV